MCGLRVGILVSSLAGGGAERQAALWAAVCDGLGHQVAVLALHERADEFDLPAAVEACYVGKGGRFDLLRMGRAVRRLAAEVDVVVAFQPYCALLCALARVRTPILAVTGDEPRRFADTSRVPAWAMRYGLVKATLCSAPTRGLIDLHRSLGIAADGDWRQIPNIVDEAAFTTAAARGGDVLFVGRLVPYKDPLLAVEVARSAGRPLAILGDGELRDDIERAAARSGAELRLLGWHSQPWHIYPRYRVLLVTSRYETFGNMIIESLAAGTPVVSIDCDFGPREILAGASFSRVVAGGPKELASALREVVRRPHSAEEERECKRIAEGFRSAGVAPAIQDALEATLSGGPPAHSSPR